MIRFLLRFLAIWLAAAGLVMAVIDAAKSIAESRLVLTPFAETWANWAAASLDAAHHAVADKVPWLWAFLEKVVLTAPTFAVLLVVAALLFWLGRPRRRFTFAHERDL
ncbi:MULTISPECIES: hypothetical protein [Hyphomicrobiales]|uniref:ABC-type proline/glycine betaine transport system permease subunit n=1 Tax=Rhodopseudomonas julia TaxID=200617 RepID=A0ABU0C3Z8_9BRAD|nr:MULTISPECIES: hypothetical protein [Hyphomicrobiales]MCF1504934.1 hypothetical protein [Afifella sp. H1R]MCT8268900.1 hypothetical protein [Afifella sp. JA880]MDQ0325230.1 ABC-type proline/glycine betaine transport system permease subunit [Rhodopseudomonas julia]